MRSGLVSWLGKTAKSLFIFLFLFFFFSFLITTRWSVGKYHMTLSRCHNSVTDGHIWSRHRSQVTVCHMTKVTWGPWESKRIATVVKCISSREMSENSIEFSLSNSEQRDSWLNSGHRTLDADILDIMPELSTMSLFAISNWLQSSLEPRASYI